MFNNETKTLAFNSSDNYAAIYNIKAPVVQVEPVKSIPAVAEEVNVSVPITNLFAKKKTIPAPEPETTKV